MTYEQETLWLAGLLEGEGCFTRSGKCVIALSMCDEDVVRQAGRIMDSNVYLRRHKNQPENWNDYWMTSVCSHKAIEVMKRILPFMGARRKARIEELILSFDRMDSTEARRQNIAKGREKLKEIGHYKTMTRERGRAMAEARWRKSGITQLNLSESEIIKIN